MKSMSLFKLIILGVVILMTGISFAGERPLSQPSIFTKAGNIYYSLPGQNSVQITQSGNNRSPVLSSDKKTIAFIKASGPIIPNGCIDFVNTDTKNARGDEIWMYDLETKKNNFWFPIILIVINPKKK